MTTTAAPIQRIPIDRFTAFPESFERDYRAPRRPAIISGAVDDWPVRRWTPRTFKDECGAIETLATVQLPEKGVVYLQADKAHRRTVTVGEFVDLMSSGSPCYIDQADIQRFPRLAESCPIDSLVAQGRRFINLWVGAMTRSGLHYDPMDNYLIQIYGKKEAILAPPRGRRLLYPFADNIAKSRVDPEDPDLKRFPKVRRVVFSIGTLEPGDLLYIPRGWWHFLRAPEQSISLNLWHEPALSLADELGSVAALGPRGWARVACDFLVHGALNRPYERRLYSPPPTGKQLYDLCKMLLSGKVLP
jgi:lysine-specific demethylase 8